VLVDLRLPSEQREALKVGVDHVLECSDRNACDVELLMVGGFSPLLGFMHEHDYRSVVESHRTSSGLLFGLPIVMDTDDERIGVGDRLMLTYRGQDLAVMTVESRWEPDKPAEAIGCYGTSSIEHPAVRMIRAERGRFNLGGAIQGLELPERVFPCRTPAQVRASLPPGEDVVAFQCRNPIHRRAD
jgi:sulfate adenylyltransferase